GLPQGLPSISSIRLFRIRIRWDGKLTPASLSGPDMLNPLPECRTLLLVKVTSATTDQGEPPLWLRGVNTIAKPAWASAQLYSKTFESTKTRCAFFNSSRFLTDQWMPA